MAIKSTEPRDEEIRSLAPTKSSLQDRIAAFAMLDSMDNPTLTQKVVRLSLVGFPPSEIASMLQTTPATVYQYVYEAKKSAGVKKPKGKAAARKMD
jgi:DNA-directed RNA polymerase specialized sigma24 family protein